MNAEEIGRSGTLRCEHDPIALGGPGRVVVQRARLCERPLNSAIGVGDEKCGLRWAEAIKEDPVGCQTRIRQRRERKKAKGQRNGTSHRTLRTMISGRERLPCNHITVKRCRSELHLQKMRFGQMVRSDCGLRQLLNGNCRIGGDSPGMMDAASGRSTSALDISRQPEERLRAGLCLSSFIVGLSPEKQTETSHS